MNKSKFLEQYGVDVTCKDYKGNMFSFLSKMVNAIIYIFTIELPETLGDFGGILHIIWWNLVKSHRFPDSSPF